MMIQKARSAFIARNMLGAKRLCEQLLEQNRNDCDALMLLHQIAVYRQDPDGAVAHLEQYIKIRPKDPLGHVQLGEFHLRSGHYRQAISRFQKVLRFASKHPRALAGLARSYDVLGETDKARKLIAAHIGTKEESAEVAYEFANLELEAKQYASAIAVAQRHAGNASVNPSLRKDLWFLLGKAHERAGDPDSAFQAYSHAHAVVPVSFDMDAYARHVDEMISVFSREAIARMPRASNDSRLPVCIICRPRSGSTLVERIIGAHPQVHGAGEINFIPALAGDLNLRIGSQHPYPRCVLDMQQAHVNELGQAQIELLSSLAPRAQRITTKHLNLWVHLGLISMLLPRAGLIDLRRDALDNCLACYTENLGAYFPYQGDLRLLGLMHRQYERLMQHWHEVLNVPILRLDYEALVSDQEAWSRRIIDLIGLEWDDRCLQFHQEKPDQAPPTAAPTPSYQQVRQPIYKTSVGRAAKFRKHLGPLIEALGHDHSP